jgi:hypothetical protein
MEVERNKREKYTVAWRYVILRLHEAVQEIVPHLDERDSQRFSAGSPGCSSIITPLFRQSRSAACWRSAKPGHPYSRPRRGLPDGDRRGQNGDYHPGNRATYDVFIDARGQRALKTKDLPFRRYGSSCRPPATISRTSGTTTRYRSLRKYEGVWRLRRCRG